MGVLNVTPDSFSDGGRFADTSAAVDRALEMTGEGADIVDIGGESTRPGAASVSGSDERERVVPIIESLRAQSDVAISIDTSKATVAKAALDAGADIVNDVTGLTGDARMMELISESDCGVVVMHMKGDPRTMQTDPHYDDVVGEVRAFHAERLTALESVGVSRKRVLFDPGIGFGKTVDHNLELIARLPEVGEGLRSQLLGVSRKSFIGKTLDVDVDNRIEGTAAAVAVCVWNGAACVRVHDVRAMRRVADMTRAILDAR